MVTFLLEILGTAAFAVTGAAAAIGKRLDIFGVLFVSVLSAVGGGVIRDVVLGNVPPLTFKNPVYIVTALGCAFAVMGAYVRLKGVYTQKRVVAVIDVCDAVGLAVFTVSGINIAVGMGYQDNGFLLCFVGLVTGVGGGVLRDMAINRTSVIFKKEIYATASIAGSAAYIWLYPLVGTHTAGWAAVFIIAVIRILSISKKLNLPVLASAGVKGPQGSCTGEKI